MASLEESVERIAAALERLADRIAAAPQDGDLDIPEPPCPKCGERENIQDTSAPDADLRRTCLCCGASWQIALQEVANG